MTSKGTASACCAMASRKDAQARRARSRVAHGALRGTAAVARGWCSCSGWRLRQGSAERDSRGAAGGGRGAASRIRTATPTWTRRRKRRGSWAKRKTSSMAAAAVRAAEPVDSGLGPLPRPPRGHHTRSRCWSCRRSSWWRSSPLCPALRCPTWRWCARNSGRSWTRKQSGGGDVQRVIRLLTYTTHSGFCLHSYWCVWPRLMNTFITLLYIYIYIYMYRHIYKKYI